MKIKKTKIVFYIDVLVTLVFFNPQFVSQIPFLNRIVDILRILIFLIFLFKWIINGKIKKIHNYIFLFLISRLIATVISGDDVFGVIILFFPIITMMLFIDVNREELSRLIKSVYIASLLLIVGNTITLLLFPQGLYSTNYGYNVYWLIGQKQDWNTVYIAFFTCSLMLWEKNVNHIKTLIGYACIVYSFTVQLPLGLILYFLVVISLFFISKKRKVLKAKFLFSINAILECILIIVAFIFEKINWLNVILSAISANDIMSKRDTLMIRIEMWKEGLAQVLRKPIFGLGSISDIRWNRLFHNVGYHPNFHNTPVDIIVTSGIVGFVTYLMVYKCVAEKLDKSLSRHSVVLTYSIFGINILMLVEGLYAPFVWFFIFLGFYIRELDRDIQTTEYFVVERKKRK